MTRNKMLISGMWCDAATQDTFDVINPRDESVLTRVPAAGAADIDAAISAADLAFPVWASLTPFQRGRFLRDASQIVLERKDEIGRLMSLEQGKSVQEATGEVVKGADILRFYAEEGERVHGKIIANEEENTTSRVIYQALGVAAAISPWNYPIELLAWKVGAALAAGCTLVAKLPSETPLSPLAFLACLADAGLPDGVVNALTGSGASIGPALIGDPRVKKVAFTGSTAVGKSVLGYCTANLTKSSMELGGSLPMLVFNDCDLEAAVKGAVRRSFRNMGQICIAINRIYVQRDIYETFLNRMTEQTRQLIIGDGLDEPADLGPMCTGRGRRTVVAHIEDALARGASLRCGGRIPEGREKGFWFEPTIVADVRQDMLMMSEETFGPAVGVMPFDTIDEAIALANDTPYGLAAMVYTQNLTIAERCALEINAGNVAVNNPDPGVINAPYGGIKASGFGKEHGTEGLYEYLYAKHIRVRVLP